MVKVWLEGDCCGTVLGLVESKTFSFLSYLYNIDPKAAQDAQNARTPAATAPATRGPLCALESIPKGHKGQSTQHAAESTECEAESTGHKARSTERGTKSTEHRARSTFVQIHSKRPGLNRRLVRTGC